ncbi:MAG TPA: hypothetical protein VGR96_09320 [Acidobacteriaceae bacterium]|nr:hypothetical protein [Acidobacteriaceae bacterium]
MKSILLLFVLLAGGIASAEAKSPSCQLPLFVQAEQSADASATDSSVSLFLYGLKSAVMLRHGCIVDKMADAQLGLYITTLKLVGDSADSNASVIAVALAVPLNGVPIYMDHYMLVVRNSDSVDGEVNALLQNIGETLDRHSSPAQ